MSVFDKLSGKLGIGSENPDSGKTDREQVYDDKYESEEDLPDDDVDDDEYLGDEESEDSDMRDRESDNVVDFNSAAAARSNSDAPHMKVMVIEPKSFDDAQQVANNLRDKRPVVINFEHTDAESAKHIIDFISGTTYVLDGEMQKVGHNVFLCTPSNVNVSVVKDEKGASSEMPWLKH